MCFVIHHNYLKSTIDITIKAVFKIILDNLRSTEKNGNMLSWNFWFISNYFT